MDTEAFVAWALDDARTVDERFAVEVLAVIAGELTRGGYFAGLVRKSTTWASR